MDSFMTRRFTSLNGLIGNGSFHILSAYYPRWKIRVDGKGEFVYCFTLHIFPLHTRSKIMTVVWWGPTGIIIVYVYRSISHHKTGSSFGKNENYRVWWWRLLELPKTAWGIPQTHPFPYPWTPSKFMKRNGIDGKFVVSLIHFKFAFINYQLPFFHKSPHAIMGCVWV